MRRLGHKKTYSLISSIYTLLIKGFHTLLVRHYKIYLSTLSLLLIEPLHFFLGLFEQDLQIFCK